MKWTSQQQEAIEDKNHSLLVSAAAGSGKTAVLIERITQMILSGEANVDQILVVTFTRAAASEMKEKLTKAMYRQIAEDPSTITLMREQLSRMPNAAISTFDSFAYDIVRHFFYLVDVDPSVTICDETDAQLLKNQAIEEVFEEEYAKKLDSFYDFLACYGGASSDESLKEDLLSVAEQLNSMTDADGWIKVAVARLKRGTDDAVLQRAVSEDFQKTINEACSYLEKAENILEEEGLDRLCNLLSGDRERLSEAAMTALEDGFDFEKMKWATESYNPTRLTARKEEKEDYEAVKNTVTKLRKMAKDNIDKLKERCFLCSEEIQNEDMRLVADHAEEMYRLLLAFEEKYTALKKDRNQIDFNDVEHLCIRVLEDEDAAKEYRNRFKYIFIDEYQDSNYLQEAIVQRIQRPNNVFMVGDIKQSIYRFRLAEPDIFRDKYKTFAKEEETNGHKIDLNRNFRSKPKIIDAINALFEPMMDGYDEDAALYAGISDEKGLSGTPQLILVDGSKDYEDLEEFDLEGLEEDEVLDLVLQQVEAMAVAKKIKELIGREFFDTKNNCVRKIEKRDIVILMRGVKHVANLYQDVLRENGIDACLEDNSGYFDTTEISQFLDYLRVIDNSHRDISLLSVMRGPLFSFSIEELIRIRLKNRQVSYRDAVAEYAADEQDALAQKCADFEATILRWQKESLSESPDAFVWRLMRETGLYAFVGALPGGRQRQANLRAFVDKTVAICNRKGSSIYQLIAHIEAMQKKEVEVGQVGIDSEAEDTVRIMTIHKSKGLEFPVTFVSRLNSAFNLKERSTLATIHKDMGIGMRRVNPEEHWQRNTLMQNAIKHRNREEALEEEVRILYVALTRAKDFLIMTASDQERERLLGALNRGLTANRSYLEMIYPQLEKAGVEIEYEDRFGLSQQIRKADSHRAELLKKLEQKAEDDKETSDLMAELDARFGYEYPYEDEHRLRSKYSVSALNKAKTGGNDTITLATPRFLYSKEHEENKSAGYTMAERGTFFHAVMEQLDFAKVCEEGEAYAKRCLESMVERNLLLAEEAEMVDLSKILPFFETEIGKRAARARVRKETPFNMQMKLEGSSIMVQGIIDCWFEDEKGLVLLDYKSNRDLRNIREKYREQIDVYQRALCEVTERDVDEAYLYLFETGEFVDMKNRS